MASFALRTQNLRRHRSAAPRCSGDLAPASALWEGPGEQKKKRKKYALSNYSIYIYIITEVNPY